MQRATAERIEIAIIAYRFNCALKTDSITVLKNVKVFDVNSIIVVSFYILKISYIKIVNYYGTSI